MPLYQSDIVFYPKNTMVQWYYSIPHLIRYVENCKELNIKHCVALFF